MINSAYKYDANSIETGGHWLGRDRLETWINGEWSILAGDEMR